MQNAVFFQLMVKFDIPRIHLPAPIGALEF